MCSLMSMMMLLMCTVSYAGDVHNHVLGINDFITLSGVLRHHRSEEDCQIIFPGFEL